MEDILALIIVLAGVASVILAVRFAWRKVVDARNKKREEELAEQQRQIEATRKWRESMYKKMQTEAVSNTKKVPPKKSSSANTTTVSYANDSNDNLTDLATMLVLNAALHHGSAQASVDYVTDSVRVTTSDDIKPSSWSSSSSDSSSSWSSSSSDSGPSSDW